MLSAKYKFPYWVAAMKSLLQKARRLLSNLELLRDYLSYQASRLWSHGRAIRQLHEGVQVAGFNRFSEFHSSADQVAPHEYKFLTQYSFPAGLIVDVGANLGIVSLILARRFSERPVHAFEPHPSTTKALRGNVSLNKAENVEVHEAAVGDRETTVLFRAHPEKRATARRVEEEGEYATRVPCILLDEWAREAAIDTISLLKVDVEGYEKSVFEGGQSLLQRQEVGIVYFEVCPALARQAGFAVHEAAAFLEECGYSLFRLTGEETLVPTTSEVADTVELENWVALRSVKEMDGSWSRHKNESDGKI